MKNKIVGILYFIYFAILFWASPKAFPVENYQINANISETQYLKTNEIEILFKNSLREYSEFISYSKVPRGLILSIDSSIFFLPGSVEIIEESKEFLNKIGTTIKESEKPCVIEGNSNITIDSNNTYPTNWELSNAQAQKLSRYFIEVHNINPNKIRAIGFGESIPAKLVQRIDFVILNYDN